MMTFSQIACAFPRSLREALELQADEKTRGVPLGGCTDLMVQWESGARPMPARAIHVKALPELQGISEVDGSVHIGAAVSHMEIQRSALVQRKLPALAAAAATVGGYQMQWQGTIAGNIANASPAGDLPPALMIADARVAVQSCRGERVIPLTDFFLAYRKIHLQPDELIVRFEVPGLPDGWKESFRKLGPRAAQAISKVMAAFRGHATDGRIGEIKIALGSVAPTCIRLRELEAWLRGKPLTERIIAEAEQRAASEVRPIDDIRSTAEYRRWVSGRLVRGCLEAFIAGPPHEPL